LAHGPKVRVIAVEPSAELNEQFRRNLGHAGWLDRATLVRCFLGGKTEFQQDALAHDECRHVPFVTEEQFIRENALERIDFLKCDIEGSEFDLLRPESRLLAMTKQLAIELHDQTGDRQAFIRMLEAARFETMIWRTAPRDCIVLARRTTASAQPPVILR
jgi:FkbM family methyltransferase